MCRTSNSSRVLLIVIALACTSCLLPPLWLTVEEGDAGVDRSATRMQSVAAQETALDASMPMIVLNDASMLDASTAITSASDAGATGAQCTMQGPTACVAGLVCAFASDTSGVCVDPHSPCLHLSDTALCDPQGVMYQCGPGGTIGGQQTCASPTMCRAGLTSRHCRICEPGSYKCSDYTLMHCSSDGASWGMGMTCASAVLCDAAHGKCGVATCKPRSGTCNGATLTKCNDDGTGFITQQCASSARCNARYAECN